MAPPIEARWLLPMMLATVVATSGCFTVRAELPGALRSDVATTDTDKVAELKVETTAWFFLAGLLGEPPKDFVANEIRRQVQAKGADGVAGLTYRSEFGCVDLAIGGCTAGLVTPRSIRVSGDIVRIRKAPLAGRPARAAAAPLAAPTPAEPQQVATHAW
jgi:hypothetical protein